MTPAPPLVLRLLRDLGLEVGDYHQDAAFTVVTTSGGRNKLYQIKLEGYGQDCVPGKGRKAAKKAAEGLAQLLVTKEGWAQSGVIETADDEVWCVTWGLRGPFTRRQVREGGVDLEEVIVVEV